MDKCKEKLKVLAGAISRAGRIVAKDNIAKDYIVGDGCRVTSDGGYEAIYIGNLDGGNTDGYMCLYTNNTPQRNSFPSKEEIAKLLYQILNKKILETGEGKANYFDWYEFGGMEKQLNYFSKVVSKLAGVTMPKKTKKKQNTMSGHNPEKISSVECLDYLSSWVETLQDRINQGDPRDLLYEEQIVFLNKAVEIIRKTNKLL